MNPKPQSATAELQSQQESWRVLAGKGSGRPCNRCQEPIGPNEIEYEIELTARGARAAPPVTLIFHIRCYDAWRKTLSPESG